MPEYAPLGSYRRGDLIVLRKGGHFPAYCIKCGAPTMGGPIKRKFSQKTGFASSVVGTANLIAPWLGGIAAAGWLATRETEWLEIPMCAQHKDNYQTARALGLTLMIGSGVTFVILAIVRTPLPFFLADTGLLICGAVSFNGFLNVRAVTVDPQICILQGAASSFLSHLPVEELSPPKTAG